MHDLVRVQDDQGVEDAPEDHRSILFTVVTSLLNLVEQLLSIEVLENKMDVVV